MPPVALVVGASRGIGRQIAIDLAKAGYAVVVAAKSVSDPSHPPNNSSPDPTSPESTISTVVREIVTAGGTATAIPVDVRDESSVQALISASLRTYARLDVVIYNAGAIWWSAVATTPLRRYRLMQRVNADGLYAVVQAALPHMTLTPGRFIVVSPPIYSRFVRGKTAYAMGKMAMSVLTMGLAMDFEREGVGMAITSLWPAVAIESAATNRLSLDDRRNLRKPSIFSDAVLAVLAAPREVVNGQLLLDEDFLRDHAGVSDFSPYSLVPGAEPRRIMPAKLPDLTVAEQDDEGVRYDSAKPKL